MAFWGVLLQPNEPYTLKCDLAAPKRLRISQATLADRIGIWNSRSVVRCAVGSKEAVYICSLSMREVSSCQLDLEFQETQDVVFSVKGPRGVHLVGYFHDSDATKLPDVDNNNINTAKDMDHITNNIHDVELQNNNTHATKEFQEKVLTTDEKSGLGRLMSSDDVADDQQIKELNNSIIEENRSSLQNNDYVNVNTSADTHIQSKKVEKKKKKKKDIKDSNQLDKCFIKDLKQQNEDQNVFKEREKENAINENKEERSHTRLKDRKRRREQGDDDGNPKGIINTEDGGDKICQVTQVVEEEKSKDGYEDHNIEQAGSHLSSISHKKKKKKARMGEATIRDDKDLTSNHNYNNVLESQSELQNRIHGDDECGSDNNAMKDKKEKNLTEDEDKHVDKKREVGKDEEATDEGMISSKAKQKSSTIVKGDQNHVTSAQLAANAKVGGDNDEIKVAMEVEAKDDGDKCREINEKKVKARSKRRKEYSSTPNN